MPISKRKAKAGLKKIGFIEVNEDKDHYTYQYRTINGDMEYIYTKISRSSKKDIPDGLMCTMAKQCGLTTQQFKDMINGKLTREEYEAIVL